MEGKIVLITGATSGIGKEMAVGLAKLGATIYYTSRNVAKGKAVQREIIERSGNDKVDFGMCDLASFKDVCSFAREYLEKHNRLHVLCNNAGIWTNKFHLTNDGIEETLQVNYLSAFLLTRLLIDTLVRSAPSRVVNTASEAHWSGTINFDDIERRRAFDGYDAYAQSKLADIIFTKELARRVSSTGVTVNCFHPGLVASNLFDEFPPEERKYYKTHGIPPEEGAKTGIYLASSPEVKKITGRYFIKEQPVESSEESNNEAVAGRLWQVSEEYVKRAPCYK